MYIQKIYTIKAINSSQFCSEELLAHILYEKYCKAVPLYRLEKDFEALGFRISRTTMANWIINVAETYFKPVYDIMKTELLEGDIIHADETVVQVLREPERKAKTQSRMWVYCSSKSSGKNNVLFEYQPTRNGDNAKAFLGSYSGYLYVTDMTVTTSWQTSQDAAAGLMQGENFLMPFLKE